jgi:hypothetical protein
MWCRSFGAAAHASVIVPRRRTSHEILVDLRELCDYIMLEQIDFGSKAVLLFDKGVIGAGYVATLDIENARFPAAQEGFGEGERNRGNEEFREKAAHLGIVEQILEVGEPEKLLPRRRRGVSRDRLRFARRGFPAERGDSLRSVGGRFELNDATASEAK